MKTITITVDDVWKAVGVFNEKKIPVALSPGFCCSYHNMQYFMCPIGICCAADNFGIWQKLMKEKLFDEFGDFCVAWADTKYGADFFYYFGRGFDLLMGGVEEMKKIDEFREWFKAGVLCRQRFIA